MTRRRALRPWEPNPETILEDLMALDRRVKFPGEPLPVYMVEALRAGYRRWRQERKAKAAERSIARQRAREAEQKARGTIADRMLAVMQPGQWHGRGDVIAAADIEPGNGKWKMHVRSIGIGLWQMLAQLGVSLDREFTRLRRLQRERAEYDDDLLQVSDDKRHDTEFEEAVKIFQRQSWKAYITLFFVSIIWLICAYHLLNGEVSPG